MTRLLNSLTAAIDQGLLRQQNRTDGRGLAEFSGLQRAASDLDRRFNALEKALAPPREKRRQALGKFRDEKPLTGTEWRLVFAGLSDQDPDTLRLLDDSEGFTRVHAEVSERIERRTLNRRDWLALCFSYFSFDESQPEVNANWRTLRNDIDLGFDVVRGRSSREKAWMQIVQQHRDLFGDGAGKQLAEEIFSGRAKDLSALHAIAQIPDSSWLWQRVFAVLVSRVFELDDENFQRRLPELVALGQLNTLYLNQVLSACLTRYHKARFRDQPSPLLKQAALDHWGSPQMRSRQNAWLQYVSEPVCAMVAGWFAREDLQHFFTLLQGEAEVDQSRLFYWLRFASQMSYTRIIMGRDAWTDQGSEFVEFRNKNKGRLSRLEGGQAADNAVVMQIGGYFFVEFSRTGNACYVYRASSAPFNPDKTTLELNYELKQSGSALLRMRHAPAPSRPDRVEGWLEKYDQELRTLGIVPSDHLSSAGSGNSDSILADLAKKLSHVRYQVEDNRHKGGVLKVILAGDNMGARTTLLRLGFKAVGNKALTFWRN